MTPDDETPIYWRHTDAGRVRAYPCAADRAPPCMAFVDVDGHLCARCYDDARTHGGMAEGRGPRAEEIPWWHPCHAEGDP